ncbi:RHS repeat protein [Pseudomonas sp. GD04058]|uniref:RHS repeat domain-containing protein n=1 Tax=Pseudomonas sp. GD04058 TaxID=2975429 RepID=UPI0002A25CE7|nr:RHS repeat-associated core domain-containing protein [Pseudomonas sp. GD04058]MDG9882357.1 RHS repeat protein [Pseudomonas sp. GD04058]
MSAAVHALTPVLHAVDPRGLVVRQVDYCRDTAQAAAETRVQRQGFGAVGHHLASWDPRLWASNGPANRLGAHGLSGRELSSDRVDSGFRCTLFGEAGQPVWSEDGQGNHREFEYDGLLRVLAIHEQSSSHPRTCSERRDYAGADPALAPHNACGRLLRRDDTAGSRRYPAYALCGAVAFETWRFLGEAHWPDWPLEPEARDALLETESASTLWRHTALGEVREQIDASGNRQYTGLDLLGRLRNLQVWSNGQEQPRVLVQALRYDAAGHVVEELLGNGVRIGREHRPEDGRLTRLHSSHASGRLVQDLHYLCDPAGNVLSIEDRAQPVRHFANQRVEARCEYRHDSLGQLIEARGQEAGAVRRGPGALDDPAAVSNYRQTYEYDAGGNLLRLVHVGAQAHGRVLVAAAGSNRCLAAVDERPPAEDDYLAAYDRNGNPRQLQAGQTVEWDLRNRLSSVSPVRRDEGLDDCERYVYDGEGQRRRKRRLQQAGARTLLGEVRYLPGLERHRRSAGGEHYEVLVVQAGTCAIRLLHWLDGRPDAVPQDQCRYALGDHLGSCQLELDDEAGLISQETYYPFGETAWSAARNEVEASYRTLRYSGKERDASGLYYYGARYYRADWQRWLNPDPAGEVDGLNLYRMVGNAPVNRRDADGYRGFDVLDEAESELIDGGDHLLASGLDNFPMDMQGAVRRSFQIARGMLKDTVDALGRRPDEQLNEALYSTFGITDFRLTAAKRLFLAQLQGVFQAAHDGLLQLEHGQSWRLMLSEPQDLQHVGATRQSQGRGARLELAARHLRGNLFDSAVTSMHEEFHVLTTDLFFTSPEDMVTDYWYSVSPLSEVRSIPALVDELHATSQGEVALGPDEADMNEQNSLLYSRLIKREAARFGLREPLDANQRRDYFTTHAGIRQAVVMRNADSLAGFVLMTQRLPHR